MKIQKTQDYDLFKRIEGNRKVHPPHVARLKEAISKNPQITTYTPILVNRDMEVIDGQHRLDAIQSLDLPIYYLKIDNLSLKDVQQLNSAAKTWAPLDYAISYAELGNQYYIEYLRAKRANHVNHAILVHYLSFGREVTNQMFKDGNFTIPDLERAEQLIEEYCQLRDIYPHLSQYKPALGMLRLQLSQNYNHKRMVNKLTVFNDKIQEQRTITDYSREFERIYNFKAQGVDVRLF